MRLLGLFAFFLASLVSPAVAQTGEQNDSAQSSEDSEAIQLAKFIYSKDKVRAQVSKALDQSLRNSLATDADMQNLEGAFPGLIDVTLSSVTPVILQAYDEKMPLLWEKISAIYRKSLTAEEIGSVLKFFQSDAGVRYVAALNDGVNIDKSMDVAIKSQGLDDEVRRALQRDLLDAVRKANMQTSSADKVTIFRFENSSAGRKLIAIIPEIQQTQAEWDFYFPDDAKIAIAKARNDAVADFIQKSDAAETAKE